MNIFYNKKRTVQTRSRRKRDLQTKATQLLKNRPGPLMRRRLHGFNTGPAGKESKMDLSMADIVEMKKIEQRAAARREKEAKK